MIFTKNGWRLHLVLSSAIMCYRYLWDACHCCEKSRLLFHFITTPELAWHSVLCNVLKFVLLQRIYVSHIASVSLTGSLRKEGFFLKLWQHSCDRTLPQASQHTLRQFYCERFSTPKAWTRIFLPNVILWRATRSGTDRQLLPGMSARNFSPIGANVCYRESIMKENSTRSDAFESVQRSEAQVATILPGPFANSFTNYAILSYRCLKNWGQKSQPALI